MAELDMRKLKTSGWVMLGGALAVFLGQFLVWFKAELVGIGAGSVNGFHYFFQGTIPWLLAIAIAAVIVIRAFVPNVKLADTVGPLSWAQAYLIAAGVACLLVLTRIVSVDGPSQIVSRGAGLYLAFIGTVAMVVGAVLKLTVEQNAEGAPPPPYTGP